jgi:hypothetical protein
MVTRPAKRSTLDGAREGIPTFELGGESSASEVGGDVIHRWQ